MREPRAGGDEYTDEYSLEEEEETEYDEFGRKFAILKPIIWHRQFRARDGDPGLNTYTLVARFIRAIIPKVLGDIKFEGRLAGMAIKGLFVDKLAHPGSSGHGAQKTGHSIKASVKSKLTSVKEHAKYAERKIAAKVHRGDPEGTHFEPSGVPGLEPGDQRVLQARQEEHLKAVSGGQSPSLVPAAATAKAQIPVVVTENPPVAPSNLIRFPEPAPTTQSPMTTTNTTTVELLPPQPQLPVSGQITRTSWMSDMSTMPSSVVAPAPMAGGQSDFTKTTVVEGTDPLNRPPVSS
jgi:hypothetical protein